MTFEQRKSEESSNVNPYAAPVVSSDLSNENAGSNRSSIRLELEGCFFVLMLLFGSMAMFAASLFYNPLAPPALVYRDNGFTFSIGFVFVSVVLIAIGAIVLYNELRKKSSPRR